jgi:hypothetical protein
VRYIIFAWEQRGNCGGLLQRHAGNDAHRGEQEAHHSSPEGASPAAVGLLFAVFMTAAFGALYAVLMTAAFGALFAVFMTVVVAASATTADIF